VVEAIEMTGMMRRPFATEPSQALSFSSGMIPAMDGAWMKRRGFYCTRL
jgi:hypothetical protein